MHSLDPTDRDLAKKRAREAGEADLVGLDTYIKQYPTLDASGFPIDPVADAFDTLYDDLYQDDDPGLDADPYGDDDWFAEAVLAQYDDDTSVYGGTYSEE